MAQCSRDTPWLSAEQLSWYLHRYSWKGPFRGLGGGFGGRDYGCEAFVPGASPRGHCEVFSFMFVLAICPSCLGLVQTCGRFNVVMPRG